MTLLGRTIASPSTGEEITFRTLGSETSGTLLAFDFILLQSQPRSPDDVLGLGQLKAVLQIDVPGVQVILIPPGASRSCELWRDRGCRDILDIRVRRADPVPSDLGGDRGGCGRSGRGAGGDHGRRYGGKPVRRRWSKTG